MFVLRQASKCIHQREREKPGIDLFTSDTATACTKRNYIMQLLAYLSGCIAEDIQNPEAPCTWESGYCQMCSCLAWNQGSFFMFDSSVYKWSRKMGSHCPHVSDYMCYVLTSAQFSAIWGNITFEPDRKDMHFKTWCHMQSFRFICIIMSCDDLKQKFWHSS